MVAGCGMTCIKYVVFFVNFLFFAVGCAAVGLGIYALVDKNDLEALTKIDKDGKLEEFNGRGLLQSGAIVLIVGGGALLLLGFLGCCGAVKEVKCMLALYAGIVVVIIIVEIVAAALAIAFKQRIEDSLQKGLKEAILKNYDGIHNSSNAFSRAFDFAQVEFRCCGVESSTDFVNSTWYNNTRKENLKQPPACCELKNRDKVLSDNEKPDPEKANCTTTEPSTANPYTNTSCYSKIKDWVMDKAAIIIGIAFGIVFIEIMAVVFACCLYRAIDS